MKGKSIIKRRCTNCKRYTRCNISKSLMKEISEFDENFDIDYDKVLIEVCEIISKHCIKYIRY